MKALVLGAIPVAFLAATIWFVSTDHVGFAITALICSLMTIPDKEDLA